MTCLRCGDELIPDPLRPHWKHCPTCCPAQAAAASTLTRLFTLDATARSYAADTRGVPMVGGSKTA